MNIIKSFIKQVSRPLCNLWEKVYQLKSETKFNLYMLITVLCGGVTLLRMTWLLHFCFVFDSYRWLQDETQLRLLLICKLGNWSAQSGLTYLGEVEQKQWYNTGQITKYESDGIKMKIWFEHWFYWLLLAAKWVNTMWHQTSSPC